MSAKAPAAARPRPRLLFVSPRFLFPMDEGGKIRTANILRGLKNGAFEITLASPVPPGWEAHADEIALVCDRFASWPAPHMPFYIKLLALTGKLPVPVASDWSEDGCAVVEAELKRRPEVMVVDFPHANVLLPLALPGATRRVMFTHNVEAEIFERHASVARFPLRLIWHSQARKMRQFEGESLRNYHHVIAVSERDAKALTAAYGLRRVSAIDTGVDLAFYRYTPPAPAPADGGCVVFCGAMNSRSNIDGVTWLLEAVWPLVRASRPAAQALIVGRNPPSELVARFAGQGVRFTGFVDDIRDHVASAQVSVIPLRVGSGTRIKAFEAMALGRPVVSTRVGIEGLDVVEGTHFLPADSEAEFASSILALLGDAPRAAAMAEAARALLEARFSWDHVASQFEAICLAAGHVKLG